MTGELTCSIDIRLAATLARQLTPDATPTELWTAVSAILVHVREARRQASLPSHSAPAAPHDAPGAVIADHRTGAPSSTQPSASNPYAPTEKQVSYYRKLVASSVFTPDERSRLLTWLETKATRQLIKDQLDWLKSRVEQGRQAVTS